MPLHRSHVRLVALGVAALVVSDPATTPRTQPGKHHTRFVAVDGSARATCEDNQVFCRPFSFARELGLWLGDRNGSGATARRP